METMVSTKTFEVPSSMGVNQIDINNVQLVDYRERIINLIEMNDQDLKQIIFYKRYKHQFITYHTMLYDKRFRCRSFIISYVKDNKYHNDISYANVIVFYKYNNEYFAFIQKYHASNKRISDFAELPDEIVRKLNELYPLLLLSDDYDIISVDAFRHKCIAIEFQDVLCLSEILVDFEHD